jgi:hypothetical protein
MVATVFGIGMLGLPYAMIAGYGAVPLVGNFTDTEKEVDFPPSLTVILREFEA